MFSVSDNCALAEKHKCDSKQMLIPVMNFRMFSRFGYNGIKMAATGMGGNRRQILK